MKRGMSECRADPKLKSDPNSKKLKVLNTMHPPHISDNVHHTPQHRGEGDTLQSAATKATTCSRKDVPENKIPEIEERYKPLIDISDDEIADTQYSSITAIEPVSVLHDTLVHNKSTLYDSRSHVNSELYRNLNWQDKPVVQESLTNGMGFVNATRSGVKHSVMTNSVSQLQKNEIVHSTQSDHMNPTIFTQNPSSVSNLALCIGQEQQKEKHSMSSVNQASDTHTSNHMNNENMVSTSQHLSNSHYPLSNHTELIQPTNFVPPDCNRYGDIQQNMPQYTPDMTEASIAALQLVQELASSSQPANHLSPVLEQQARNTSSNMVAHEQYQNINTGNQLQNTLSSHSFFQNQSYYQQKENQVCEIDNQVRSQQRSLCPNQTVDSFGHQTQNMSYGPRHIDPGERASSAFTDLSQNNKYYNQQDLPVNPAMLTQNNQLNNTYGVYTQTSHSHDYSQRDYLNNIPPIESQRFPRPLNGEIDLRNRKPYAVRSLDNVSPFHNPSHHKLSLHDSQWSGPANKFQSQRYQECTMNSCHNLRSRSVSLTNNLECLSDPPSPVILKRQKNRKKFAKHSHSLEHVSPMADDKNYRFAGMIPELQNKPTELWVVNPSYAMNVSHKTLMSQYIEFLIEENEQITEMSQSFSLPVDIIVTEDLYIMDIARKDTPFPTPKFLDWVHKCYPRIDVKSFIYRPALCTREREMRRYHSYNMPPQQLLEETFFYFQRKRMSRYCPI